MDWITANTACEELILNGYSDWHLPTKEELYALYVNLLYQIGVGGFARGFYWSFDGGQSLSNGEQRDLGVYTSDFQSYNINYVRAVRAF